MNVHTLTYLRIALEYKDGARGFLYHHDWGTGWQDLIFPTHEAAGEFLTKANGGAA